MNQDCPAGRHPGCTEKTCKQSHHVSTWLQTFHVCFQYFTSRSWGADHYSRPDVLQSDSYICLQNRYRTSPLQCLNTKTIRSVYKCCLPGCKKGESVVFKVRESMSICVPAQRFLMTHHCHHSRLTALKQLMDFRRKPSNQHGAKLQHGAVSRNTGAPSPNR